VRCGIVLLKDELDVAESNCAIGILRKISQNCRFCACAVEDGQKTAKTLTNSKFHWPVYHSINISQGTVSTPVRWGTEVYAGTGKDLWNK